MEEVKYFNAGTCQLLMSEIKRMTFGTILLVGVPPRVRSLKLEGSRSATAISRTLPETSIERVQVRRWYAYTADSTNSSKVHRILVDRISSGETTKKKNAS